MLGFPVLHYLLEFPQSNSCPLSRWCHPTISSSLAPLSSCPQSFPELGSFPMSWLFTSRGRSIGASSSAAVLPMNIQGWFPLGLNGLISLPRKSSKELTRVLSRHHSWKASVQCSAFFVIIIRIILKKKKNNIESGLDLQSKLNCQAPLSMGFSRQEYWRRLPFPSPGDPRDCIQVSCIAGRLLHCRQIFLLTGPGGKPKNKNTRFQLLRSVGIQGKTVLLNQD